MTEKSLSKKKKNPSKEVGMCTQAVYLMKQAYWGRNPSVIPSCSRQFSLLTSCLLKLGVPLCNHLLSLWRSGEKAYHQLQPSAAVQPQGWSTAGCGAGNVCCPLELVAWLGLKEEAGVSRGCVDTLNTRRCVGTAWTVQHLRADAVFLYWCD